MTEAKKGPGRGRGYKPRFAPCKKCGEMFWKDTARRVYCDACREIRKEERKEETRERMRELYSRKREGLLPLSKIPTVPEPANGFRVGECRVWRECEFGNEQKPGCNYFMLEGELRTKGGRHRVIEGRCDRFRPRTRRRGTGWQEIYHHRRKAKGGWADD